ncbi:MAG: NAD-dependent epimerase/dehydratase family protein [Candidatus Sulfotelmatobacter sp.]
MDIRSDWKPAILDHIRSLLPLDEKASMLSEVSGGSRKENNLILQFGGNAVRVLVTGGAGFIGSHLVDRFLREGFQVRILDSLDPRIHPLCRSTRSAPRFCSNSSLGTACRLQKSSSPLRKPYMARGSTAA